MASNGTIHRVLLNSVCPPRGREEPMHSDWVTLVGQPLTCPQRTGTASPRFLWTWWRKASAAWGLGQVRSGLLIPQCLGSVRGCPPMGHPGWPQRGEGGHRSWAWGLCLPRASTLQGGGGLETRKREGDSGRLPEGWHTSLLRSPHRGESGCLPTPRRELRPRGCSPRPWSRWHLPLGVLP